MPPAVFKRRLKVKTSGNRYIAQKQKILTLNLLCDLGNVATERHRNIDVMIFLFLFFTIIMHKKQIYE